MVLKTNPRFGFSWGEKITVFFYKGEVWTNSVDSDSGFFSSFRNKTNLELVHRFLSGNRRISE